MTDAVTHQIQIYTLGTLRVVRDGYTVAESDWQTRQARQLLKILINLEQKVNQYTLDQSLSDKMKWIMLLNLK